MDGDRLIWKEIPMSESVLLVDDEMDFLEAMSERMTARGMEVTTASSATEAIEIIEKLSFDAIILDFQMPGMDGMEALKAIKAKRPESQIILLTGYATVEKGVEAMKVGATDFIEKPADLEALSEKIKKAKAERMLIAEKQQAGKVLEMIKKYGI
jgi:DNA-binding NtrC family response regulator